MRVDSREPISCASVGRDLLAQEARHARRIGGQHRLARDRVVQRHEDVLAAKHQVGGVFGLADAPVPVVLGEHIGHRAQPVRVAREAPVQSFGVEGVGQRLRASQVGHAQEGVVLLHELDALAPERARQRAVAVAVELQAERRPGRHAQVAQAELLVDEVEVVVQALALIGAQEDVAVALVQPGLVARAGLHRRDHMHQPRRVAAHGQHARHQVFLADVALVDVLDLHASGLADLLRTLADALAQRLGKARVVEDADAARVQKARHPARVARAGQRARHDDAVVARQHAVKVRRVPISQCRRSHGRSPRHRFAGHRITCLVPALPA